MKETVLLQSGEATCRGELAFRYVKGERAKILDTNQDGTLQIVLLEGEGNLLTVDKEMITYM